MHARAIDDAQVRLLDLRQDEVQDTTLSGVALSASLVSTVVCPPLVVPLFVGGLAMGMLGVRAIWRRWDLVDRLADDRDAYAIPQVREYAARDACMKRRLQYAALTRSWADGPDAALAGLCDQLEALARELEDATLELDPSAALACRRLLTDPTVSPLFDEIRDVDELRSSIARIRAGFRPAASRS